MFIIELLYILTINIMNKNTVNKTTTLKSPIGRVGGKSKLSKDIVAQFPEHKHYVEVFG